MLSATPVQPVHPGKVAAHLVAPALAEPTGHTPDFADPETRLATDLAADWLRSRGRHLGRSPHRHRLRKVAPPQAPTRREAPP